MEKVSAYTQSIIHMYSMLGRAARKAKGDEVG